MAARSAAALAAWSAFARSAWAASLAPSTAPGAATGLVFTSSTFAAESVTVFTASPPCSTVMSIIATRKQDCRRQKIGDGDQLVQGTARFAPLLAVGLDRFTLLSLPLGALLVEASRQAPLGAVAEVFPHHLAGDLAAARVVALKLPAHMLPFRHVRRSFARSRRQDGF